MSPAERSLREYQIRTERKLRKQLGVPLLHPELLLGADEAAELPDFQAWAGELAADGMAAGDIILAVRQEEGQ